MHEDERHRWSSKVAAQGNTITAQRAEITTLRARLAEVERERDDYRSRLETAFRRYTYAEEKSRRLVECVRKAGTLNPATLPWRLTELLATVSDLIDEVKR